MTKDCALLTGWLAQVSADSTVSAEAFRLAFRLSQAADAAGWIAKSSIAKPSQEHGGEVAGLLDQLA